ncbi:hypothetical protein ACFWR9_40885 [Streptomyces sp. NPDC058534]|uniref:hypothetical protein n=1 Tax=Streptomyces sp. NPDC058534 TaxID=3346541 RepID=UPI0036683B3A
MRYRSDPAAFHMDQAAKAAKGAEKARQALTAFRRSHGDPESWTIADFDGWLKESDAVLAKEADR